MSLARSVIVLQARPRTRLVVKVIQLPPDYIRITDDGGIRVTDDGSLRMPDRGHVTSDDGRQHISDDGHNQTTDS
jgi:hypothetical protein